MTQEKVNALAEKYFSVWKKGDFVSKINTEPVQTETRYTHIQVPDFPPVVALNFKAPAYSDNDMEMAAVDVMNAILLSEKSALYNKLVVNEQKLRSLDGGANSTRDPYLIEVQASVVEQKDMQYAKDEIMKAIEKMKTTPVDKKQLEDAKTRLRYSFAMGIDSPSKIAEAVSSYTWITGDPESLNRSYANYANVTADDIMRVAKKYYVAGQMTVGTISADASSPIK